MRWSLVVLVLALSGCAAGDYPPTAGDAVCTPRIRVYYPDYAPCAPLDTSSEAGAETDPQDGARLE